MPTSHLGLTMLDITTALPEPMDQFRVWYDEAVAAGQLDPTAMTLSTVSEQGMPSARTVLFKDADAQGITFFTNYRSRKGRDLEANHAVALTIYWATPDYQIRIEGTVETLSAEESDTYFRTRALESQIGAWASEQSAEITSSEALAERFQEFAQKFAGQDVPRPPHWGGYRVRPRTFDFMERKPGRLHDRILYVRNEDGSWTLSRLAP